MEGKGLGAAERGGQMTSQSNEGAAFQSIGGNSCLWVQRHSFSAAAPTTAHRSQKPSSAHFHCESPRFVSCQMQPCGFDGGNLYKGPTFVKRRMLL